MQKEDRLKFCKEYIDHDYTNIVFIDETLFKVGWVNKGNGERKVKSIAFHLINIERK